jgi:hypothetical protein
MVRGPVSLEPLGYGCGSPRSGLAVSPEEQNPLMYTPGDLGRSDCTDSAAIGPCSAPIAMTRVDCNYPPKRHVARSAYVGVRRPSAGIRIAAVTCPEGWGINREDRTASSAARAAVDGHVSSRGFCEGPTRYSKV